MGRHVHMCVAGCLTVETGVCAKAVAEWCVYGATLYSCASDGQVRTSEEDREGSFGKALLVKQKDSGKLLVMKEIGISKVNRVLL